MTKKELTKEKIRKAAHKCVARFGFEKTTLDDIGKEVGLNKASLYYYYTNKEEIFFEITTEATRAFLESLQVSTLAVQGGIEAEVRHFLVERSAYYLNIAAEIHISQETLRQVEHLFWAQIKDVELREVQFLAERLDNAITSGRLKPINTTVLAQNLIALCEGIKKSAKERQLGTMNYAVVQTEITENLDFMLHMIWQGLRS